MRLHCCLQNEHQQDTKVSDILRSINGLCLRDLPELVWVSLYRCGRTCAWLWRGTDFQAGGCWAVGAGPFGRFGGLHGRTGLRVAGVNIYCL
jgi:hypothetical protein